jgi:hypothetical protein
MVSILGPCRVLQENKGFQDLEIITAEGWHIAHDGRWITIYTVESLTTGEKPIPKIGSVYKTTVINRIQEHFNKQSDEVSQKTLSNTSSHCGVIGGRIDKQVVSTIEAKNYQQHLAEIGWKDAKAGKDFITLKRMIADNDVEPGEAEVNSAIK